MPGVADERAIATVTLPYLATHFGRNAPASGSPLLRTTPSGSPALEPLETLDQCIQRAVEYACHVVRLHGVAQQFMSVAQLVVGPLRKRDLQTVALGCKRLDASWRPRNRNEN